MSKAEFMNELAQLLQNIPENERVEALNYYEEYFNDAGEENEQNVLLELVSPQRVADNIKDGLRANMDARDNMQGSGANSAHQSGAAYQNGTSYQGSTIYQGNTFYQNGTKPTESESLPGWAIALIVVGIILFSPVLLGLLGTLMATAATVIIALVVFVIGFGGSGIALAFAGVILVGTGLFNIISTPFVGITLAGIGLLCLAIGILFIIITVLLCGYAVPAVVKGIIWLCKKPFEKK